MKMLDNFICVECGHPFRVLFNLERGECQKLVRCPKCDTRQIAKALLPTAKREKARKHDDNRP